MPVFFLFMTRLFLLFSLADFSIGCEIESLYQIQITHKAEKNFDLAKEIKEFIAFSKETGPEIIPICMNSLRRNKDNFRPMYQGVADPFEPFIEGGAISQFKDFSVPYLAFEINMAPSINQKDKDYLYILNEILFGSTHDIYSYVPDKIPWLCFEAKENVKNIFKDESFPKMAFPSSSCLLKCINRKFKNLKENEMFK